MIANPSSVFPTSQTSSGVSQGYEDTGVSARRSGMETAVGNGLRDSSQLDLPSVPAVLHQHAVTPLSDEELEAHIRSSEWLENEARARFDGPDGTFADAAEADQWKAIKDRAIAARGPVYVARLRAKKGLD
jgi:hypothetical protein